MLREAITFMQRSSVSSSVTVSGAAVITSRTDTDSALRPCSSTLMAQSPWVMMPTSFCSSSTSTERTRWSR
ncbi:MAG: hypothetical protein RLZ58_1325, partial [Pseudomonadota bacterium]